MKNRQRQKDTLFSILIFCSAFAVNLLIQKLFTTQTLVPMIFVFGVFLISLKTHGYCYGITSAIVSVFAVNFAFTYPYYVFDFFVGESILSAVIMLAVAVSTSTLNSRIRDQEKLRAESEKERMRGNLLRAISHDLRTPLASIEGADSLLLEQPDLSEAERRTLLEQIRQETRWLTRITENMLSVTRMAGEQVSLHRTDEVVEEIVDSAVMKLRRSRHALPVTVIRPQEILTAPMDATLMEQVLLNLLENAALHGGRVKNITLTARRRNDKAELRVEDDGVGLDSHGLENVFDGMRTRAEQTSSDRRNMGIGLTVCRTIVNAHGGQITAANRPQGGASFCITLPLAEIEEGEHDE